MKKFSILILASLMALQSSLTVSATDNINLPNIGTAAVATLSIGQEIEMGDYYTRMLQGSAPIIDDPLLHMKLAT